jgi:GAF domain-containing protein
MVEELPLGEELMSAFARMSGLLLSRETVTSALTVVTSLAVEAIPGTSGAGVTLVDARGRKTTSAATDPLVAAADARQYELDEGPCLSAWRDRAVLRIDDMTAEPRWPAWTPAAARMGLRSSLSAPLVAGGDSVGAIKVYSTDPAAFGQRAEHLLTMFAAQAAVLVANVQSLENARRLSDNLKAALRSRDVIGMAKGILIGQDGVDEDKAFAMLVTRSQREQKKLRDVAAGLIQSAQGRPR